MALVVPQLSVGGYDLLSVQNGSAYSQRPHASRQLRLGPGKENDANSFVSTRAGVGNIFVLDRLNVWLLIDETARPGIERSAVLRTSDGGTTWERQIETAWGDTFTGKATRLNDIFFVDREAGWAAGAGGIILSTIDGGKTWLKQQSPTSATLTRIAFRTSQVGWVLGDNGHDSAGILSTTDGGEQWQWHPIAANGWLNDMCFSDTHNGWIVGDRGQARFTRDAGHHWLSRAPSLISTVRDWRLVDVEFMTVAFVNSTTGFVTARIRRGPKSNSPSRGVVLRTDDGGTRWESFVVRNNIGILSSFFLNESEGWIVQDDLRSDELFHTVDGGRSWTVIRTYLHNGILSVHFADSKMGWLIKSTSDQGNANMLYRTEDGGGSWLEHTAWHE
jgi:photosystem II stability/assembly factor-like uncharacterized protein